MQLSLRSTIVPKVYQFTSFLSIVFCLIHLIYSFLFLDYGLISLFIYELFSVLFYAIMRLFYKDVKDNLKRLSVLLTCTILEMAIHVALTTICLGFGSKFSHYLYGVYIFILLENYISSKRQKTVILLFTTTLIYISSAFILDLISPLYFQCSSLIRLCGCINPLLVIILFVVYVFFFTTMISDFESSLVSVATRDSLTGVRNRTLLIELNYSDNSNVAILDIDNFKKINDKYGHGTGDAVLINLGHLLLQLERQYSKLNVMRWGGEEFVIEYTGNTNDFIEILNKLMDFIHSSSVNAGFLKINYRVTIGVADSSQGSTIEELISKADICLYSGKISGKDKIVYGGN